VIVVGFATNVMVQNRAPEGIEEVTGGWGKTEVSSVVPIIVYH